MNTLFKTRHQKPAAATFIREVAVAKPLQVTIFEKDKIRQLLVKSDGTVSFTPGRSTDNAFPGQIEDLSWLEIGRLLDECGKQGHPYE